jgi:hypothetical protein
LQRINENMAGAEIPSVKIRRIRVDPRAIGMHNSPQMHADAADLRG